MTGRVVRLCDVRPDKASLRVSYGILNLAHRDGHETPAPLVPGRRYQVRILLFQNGQPVSEKDRTLTVEKVGVERGLYLWAHQRPWSYGLVAMAFALAAGWAASSAFRRD